MSDILVSIIIPARTEKYLNRTIRDILEKATTNIEIIPILDGYPKDYPYKKIIQDNIHYIEFPEPENLERRKRQGVHEAVKIAKGKFVCWLDAHCVVGHAFDEILARDCTDKMIMVPRRYRLNPRTWDREGWASKPPIDYEYFMWQYITKKNRLSGYRWDVKAQLRAHIPIDDIFTVQGSFIFTTKEWFYKAKLMKIEGYTGWGQEGEECCLTTIKEGGRAVVNKNTWYAHMHKGQMHGRMYKWTSVEPSYAFSYNTWVHDNREVLRYVTEHFGMKELYGGPFPNWPKNWEEIIDKKDIKLSKEK